MECSECVYGFLSGGCGMSKYNAACVSQSRPWRNEPKDKLLDYIKRMRDWETARFNKTLTKLDEVEKKVNEL